ncbi:MAG TPA: hypothetical protein VHB77_20660, partial [Planctomycetaceae bacterium]|nr:hypothetical protein [Planctomycetaceae bacterium]
PAPHRVFHWIAVRLADPPDWVSPYFIRELRALLCRIPFGILLLILVCCGWFLAFLTLVEPSFERRLQCLTAMQMVLGFYVAVLTPLMVLLGLQGGHDHERDLIRTCCRFRMSPIGLGWSLPSRGDSSRRSAP